MLKVTFGDTSLLLCADITGAAQHWYLDNLPAEALQRMEEMGRWLDKNGYAIYGTRPLYPYCDGNKRYTQSKDGRHQYEITLLDEYPYATVKKLKKK